MYKYFFVYQFNEDKVTQTFWDSDKETPQEAFEEYILNLTGSNYKLLSGKIIKEN